MTFTLKNPRNWHRWFAWHPVRVYLPDTKPFSFSEEAPPKTYYWLCWVERRSRSTDLFGCHLWEYRPATSRNVKET